MEVEDLLSRCDSANEAQVLFEPPHNAQVFDQIFVSFDKTYTLNIELQTSTVEDIKRIIQREIKIPQEDFWIRYNHKILNKGLLRDFDIQKYSTLILNLRLLSCKHHAQCEHQISQQTCSENRGDEVQIL